MVSTTTTDDGSTSTSSTSSSPVRDFLTSPIGMAFVAGVIITLFAGYMVF